jgi:hypothetical protein|eukprot:COSAG01_NODE_6884_length_3448_cov_15.327566_3_plen_142_part_00
MIERGRPHSWLHGSGRPCKVARDKCGFETIDVFVGQWMPDATTIERKLLRKFLSRPCDTKHPLGAPRCWRVAGAGFNFERGAHLLEWHRVFFTYSTKIPEGDAGDAGCRPREGGLVSVVAQEGQMVVAGVSGRMYVSECDV